AGSLEWSPYLLMLARHQIAIKQLNEADATLTRLATVAQQTREALKVRSDIAAARGAAATVKNAEEARPLSACGREVQVSLGLRDWQTVRVHLRSEGPAIADIGINDARTATIRVDRTPYITVRVAGSGERTFWMKSVSGGSRLCAEITDALPVAK